MRNRLQAVINAKETLSFTALAAFKCYPPWNIKRSADEQPLIVGKHRVIVCHTGSGRLSQSTKRNIACRYRSTIFISKNAQKIENERNMEGQRHQTKTASCLGKKSFTFAVIASTFRMQVEKAFLQNAISVGK
ncbi:hypothetical protein TNCV_224421 [Trichonephila clavipes]|nr:hypothetical protein TNCV_224421 [Trichonephila clavipes]